VRVIALDRGGPYEDALRAAGVPVETIGKKFKGDPGALWRLKRRFVDLKPDLVQTWLFSANAYGRVAARWAKVPKVVASERCVDSWKSRLQLAVDRRLASWTDAFVVNAEAVKRFYVCQGIAAERIRVIHNAVPDVPAHDRAAARKLLGASDGDFVFGFIGRLWPQKRVADLLQAAEIVKAAGWPIRVAVVGDGPERERLETFAVNLRMKGYTRFFGRRNDAAALLAGFDALVLPSDFEGMPNVVLEAMQAGVPVVATRIPGTDEVVADRETGLLIPPKSPIALAEAMQQMLADRALGPKLAAAAKIRVAQRFSMAKMLAAYATFYEELLTAPAR
jgi:glycosyltransferase involved in cell wall biosynthesis